MKPGHVPTVYLVIDGSAIAFDEKREVVETVDWNDDGTPDWSTGGLCDHRGAGGQTGYVALTAALTAAEANATLIGSEIKRLPADAFVT